METFNIEHLTVRQLDFFAYNKDCIIGKLEPADGKVRGVLPEQLQGGWIPRWVGTSTKRDRGTLIILPGDDRTRDIVYHSTIRKVKAQGLDFETSKQIAKSKVRFKYEILESLIGYLKQPNATVDDALLFLATGIVPYASWIDLWRDILPESTRTFDEPRMMSFATIVTDVNRNRALLEGKHEVFATTSAG